VIQQILGSERTIIAIHLKKLVSQKRCEIHILIKTNRKAKLGTFLECFNCTCDFNPQTIAAPILLDFKASIPRTLHVAVVTVVMPLSAATANT
jgi:hypothetical protein